jgi:hypothetical protein
MAIKRKRKKRKEPVQERYEIEIEDWTVDLSFGGNLSNKTYFPGDFNEHSSLTFLSKITSPEIENTIKCRLIIAETVELEDHWKKDQSTSTPSIGSITLLKNTNLLEIFCLVPPRFFKNILKAVNGKKIKFCSVYGTKLKWRSGIVHNISFSTEKEED